MPFLSIFWVFLRNELLIQVFISVHCFRTQFTRGIMQINATNANGANTEFVLIAPHAEQFPSLQDAVDHSLAYFVGTVQHRSITANQVPSSECKKSSCLDICPVKWLFSQFDRRLMNYCCHDRQKICTNVHQFELELHIPQDFHIASESFEYNEPQLQKELFIQK